MAESANEMKQNLEQDENNCASEEDILKQIMETSGKE